MLRVVKKDIEVLRKHIRKSYNRKSLGLCESFESVILARNVLYMKRECYQFFSAENYSKGR